MEQTPGKYLAEIGRRGGKAGTGKAKARTPEQAQAAARARWDKRADKLVQGVSKAAAEIARDFHAATGRPETPEEIEKVMKLGGELASVIMRHVAEALREKP